MGSIVLQLQSDSLNQDISVSNLLRKALVVAKKLRINEFESWINSELNGYRDDSRIPEYRCLRGDVRALNPYSGLWCPLICDSPDFTDKLSQRFTGQPIASLEALINERGSGALIMPFSPHIAHTLTRGDIFVQPSLHISKSQVTGILDTVRTIILNWALRLEEEGIKGEDFVFTDAEKTKIQESKIVYQFQNFIESSSPIQIAQGSDHPMQIIAQDSLNLEKVAIFVQKALASLDKLDLTPDNKAQLKSDLTTIESQLSAPKPKKTIIGECLASGRRILESTGGAIAVELGKMILEIL
jgi:hypothetical protein